MKLIFTSLSILSWISGTAAKPPNDECTGAITIPSTISAVPYIDSIMQFSNATANLNDTFASCSDTAEATVWYYWEPTSDYIVDITAIGEIETGLKEFARIAIFAGEDCNNLHEVACGEDFPFLSSFAVITAGQKLFIVVSELTSTFDVNSAVTLTIAETPPLPSNDECIDAMIIPSDIAFPYSTPMVNLATSTGHPSDPVSSCITGTTIPTPSPTSVRRLSATLEPFPTQAPIDVTEHTVWYHWSPLVGGYYDFSTEGSTNGLGSELPTVSTGIEIFTGDTCDFSIVEVACSPLYVFDNSVRRVQLDAGTNYIIKVFAESVNVGSMVTLNVKLTPPPPSNDDCINAINVDPLTGEILFGDTSGALVDGIDFIDASVTAPGVWYKTTNASPYQQSISVSTCNEGTAYDTKLSIFSGNSCDNLDFVAGNDDSECALTSSFASSVTFLASGLTTYYIFVHGFGDATGEFSLSIDGYSNFFTLIDSKTDSVIQLMENYDFVDYLSLPTSTLNIQVNFDEAKSVRVTFDNPRRTACEKKAPYAIFGDKNGNYNDAIIPIGRHEVTATPYATADCTGTAGRKLSRMFDVAGCFLNPYLLHDFRNSNNSNEATFVDIYEGNEVPSCNMSIEVIPLCGFDVGFVEFQIHTAVTNELVLSHREQNAPYYLFGNVNDIVTVGSLEPGEYTIQVNIDGIPHPAMAFYVADDGSCN